MKIWRKSHFYNWIIYQISQTFLVSSFVNFNHDKVSLFPANFCFLHHPSITILKRVDFTNKMDSTTRTLSQSLLSLIIVLYLIKNYMFIFICLQQLVTIIIFFIIWAHYCRCDGLENWVTTHKLLVGRTYSWLNYSIYLLLE